MFDIAPGTTGLTIKDIAHILIPGRGRSVDGIGLSPDGLLRVQVARELYEQVTRPRQGRIVCSGYKSPADSKGLLWTPPDSPGERFCGMPEADIMKAELLARNVPEDVIQVERHSIDTVTNFLRSETEGHFGDGRPVAIVAQADHLHRMLSVIAPRTLRRPYLGVVAPGTETKREGGLVGLASRAIVTALPNDADRAVAVATRRASGVWRTVRALGMREYH
ncbi:ElyC/SanA/YdcF family protein [Micromonospora echinofusca]|uniref:ElyC/SanA/YdcF family protein n=1 Tax=Micromonospora echinofusca TaxID=47858 RepID=UPI000CC92A0F|nr:ElyC/SanA/YdcF family protein [Micromonospora sp. MSM11]MCL7455991.1 YdcF family protein [Micromonospora sp. MSM11]